MREKIARFETDHNKMEQCFEEMARAICSPKADSSIQYVDSLIKKIDFFVIPKKFDVNSSQSSIPVSNTLQRDKKMKTVNFFIDAPIEVYIYDTLWTIFLAKMDYDKCLLSYDVYGNIINKSALFGVDGEVLFENKVLFNRYFDKYTEWRNNAFKVLERNYDKKKDSVLISLDIKSYFYSVRFNFREIKEYFSNHELIDSIKPLTKFANRVYKQYTNLISIYRKDLQELQEQECILPIGLFSSMVLGNIYLCNFDKKVKELQNLDYYGRYVDDILIVINKTVNPFAKNQEILNDVFVKAGVLQESDKKYVFCDYRSLYVQLEKIKIIYLAHTESRALIDIYNEKIRIIPSEVEPLPVSNIDLSNFDSNAYSIENFKKENKIRDVGLFEIDSFKVSKFFSLLPRRYANIKTKGNEIDKEIERHISQITKFFVGSQSIEYYSNWLNYIYFLVITRKCGQLRNFITDTKEKIKSLKHTSLDRSEFNKVMTINKKAKETLLKHLDICLHIALALDLPIARAHWNSQMKSIKEYAESNMFDHTFVVFSLANYLEYDKIISYNKMDLSQLGRYPKDITQSFKFIWSPRFIHFDELLLLLFYHYHNQNKKGTQFDYITKWLLGKFAQINQLKYVPFEGLKSEDLCKIEEYRLEKITIPSKQVEKPKLLNVAVGSINITVEKCLKGLERWSNITITDKELLFGILRDAYNCFPNKERGTMVLVLPELCYPIYWINDLIRFSKRSGIAVVTGLQYLSDDSKQKYNYLATILPFNSGNKGYRNAFVHIREKNDYSPIEFEVLSQKGFYCRNREVAEYQVFYWKGIRLTPIVCFELTDIMARALLKGNSDVIAASVFNRDTTYFSNIIDSTARDLHAFIIQANTSFLGDSRVTGPYDRDSKDIFKMKGGENDHVVIGSVDFKRLKDYQENYSIQSKSKSSSKNRKRPDIKPLPARFKNK